MDRGLGVPSVALLLYLFSPKETAEGFLYFSRRYGASLVIFDLPSSHRSWKGRYFFVNGRNGSTILLTRTTRWAFRWPGLPLRISVSARSVFHMTCVRSSNIYDSVLSSCFSSARIDLSVEDNVIALTLAECPARPYAELIKSDIPGPSSSKICSLCCFEVLASFHRESFSHWAFRSESHQGRAFASVGDAVPEALEREKKNPGLI